MWKKKYGRLAEPMYRWHKDGEHNEYENEGIGL